MSTNHADPMTAHTCDAIVVSCIDFRFQKYIEQWEKDNLGDYAFDRVAIAGGVFDFHYVLRQVEISVALHKIKRVVLLNHEQCGAYGAAGTNERHGQDLNTAAEKINKLYPELQVDGFYVHLDGTFEKVTK